MKGTDHFKKLIKNYLDNRAKEDELFRASLKPPHAPLTMW